MKTTNPGLSSKDSSRAQYLYLTTRGRKSGRPREIEIWFTELGGRYYVIAEYPTSQWLQNLQACPDVDVRIAEERFAGTARLITPDSDAILHQKVLEASRQKYGWGDGVVVELVPVQESPARAGIE